MSATAFKNAVRRREHYERHQPAARSHLGLLEKKKDYTERAKNYHAKQKRIAELRKKAANRNPDEFYFKMQSTGTKVREVDAVIGQTARAFRSPVLSFPSLILYHAHSLTLSPRRAASTRR